jgi:Uma2 family endonuclease
LIEAPLSGEELAIRYRALCDDPCYANVPGKIELDLWGRMVMTPPSFSHGVVQGRLVHLLKSALGGEATGAHGAESPLGKAPEICIEVVSPSNSVKEMQEKIDAYLAAGAEEVWIAYPQTKRCEFYGGQGRIDRSRYGVEIGGLFA